MRQVPCPPGTTFIILRFASAEVKDVVFIEGLTRDLYLDDPDEVETYNTTSGRWYSWPHPPIRHARS